MCSKHKQEIDTMAYTRKLYSALASAVGALATCRAKDSTSEWESRWADRIEYMCKEHLPHGSGVDCGVVLDLDKSRPDRLVFTLGFHNMDSNGMYDGWSHYTAILTPCLQFDYKLRVTMSGKSRKYADIDYIRDLLDHSLNQSYTQESLYGDN